MKKLIVGLLLLFAFQSFAAMGLVYPPDSAKNIECRPTLKWYANLKYNLHNKVYWLKMATGSNPGGFADIFDSMCEDTSSTIAQLTLPLADPYGYIHPLEPNTLYGWTVRYAWKDSATGIWVDSTTPVSVFTTGNCMPTSVIAKPVILTPLRKTNGYMYDLRGRVIRVPNYLHVKDGKLEQMLR